MTKAYPLTWPVGWKRTATPERSRFGKLSVMRATQEVLRELERMGVGDWDVVVSTNVVLRLDGLPRSNQRAPEDPGVAVYFNYRGERRVLACDKWDTVSHNLHAVALHVEALRGLDRWGVGSMERAFTGYTALPESKATQHWREVLELGDAVTVSAATVKQAHKALARKRHPDLGGSDVEMAAINRARDEALEELGAA